MGLLRWGWVDERPDANSEDRRKRAKEGASARRKATDRLAKAVGGDAQVPEGQRLPDGSTISRG